jgi:hypothetical protein
MKIMIFLHGTVIMHRNAEGRSRQERVDQVRGGGDTTLADFESYVPVESAVAKLGAWQARGAEIMYLSSHISELDVAKDRRVLARHGFPPGCVFFRKKNQSYAAVVEEVVPDVFIEDDCESIGGRADMTSPFIQPDIASRIRIIVVPEFGGINSLPDDPLELTGAGSPSNPLIEEPPVVQVHTRLPREKDTRGG